MMDALRTIGLFWLALVVTYGVIAIVLIIGRPGFSILRRLAARGLAAESADPAKPRGRK